MRGPVSCAACGAKIREDRSRCLRCGAALNAPPDPGAAGYRVRTIAMGAAVVVLGGFAALLVGRSTGQPPETTVAAAVAPADAVASGAAATTAPALRQPTGEFAPAPSAVSMEAGRGGFAAYRRGDVAGSLEQFAAAAAADPDNAEVLNNYGQVLVRTGRTREAIPYFDRAIAVSDGVWAYHFNRARAYADLKEWNPAIAGYREAAKLFPEDYATAFNLGKALQANGDLQGAIAEYGRAIELSSEDQPDFYLALANALDTAGRRAGAVAIYRQALTLQVAPAQAEKIQARIKELESQP